MEQQCLVENGMKVKGGWVEVERGENWKDEVH